MMRAAIATLVGATIALGATTGCATDTTRETIAPAAQPAPATTEYVHLPTGPILIGEVVDTARKKDAAMRRELAAIDEASERLKQRQRSSKPALTCEPDADARSVGNIIVNKNCPDIMREKEKAHREFARQQAQRYPSPYMDENPDALSAEIEANSGEHN